MVGKTGIGRRVAGVYLGPGEQNTCVGSGCGVGMGEPAPQLSQKQRIPDQKEWMNLLPYLKLVRRDQGELDDSVSPGTTILV